MKFSALIVSCLFFFLSLFFLTPVSLAQSSTPPRTNVDANVPNNLHNWTQSVMIEVLSSLSCQITGIDPINTKQGCLGVDKKNGKIGFLPSPQTGGAIGFMGNMISALYTPPAHTSDYIQNLAQNFGITKKIYAQQTGTGFDGLRPLLPLWTIFRNIAYLIFVIVFVAIGLAIMLRVKIDPRTVMSIQNQIPKIIIGILLITFSYAIAGFLIDMMWVLIYLIYETLSQATGVDILNPVTIQNNNPFGALGVGYIWDIILKASYGIGVIISSLLNGGTGIGVGSMINGLILGVPGMIMGWFGLNPVGAILGTLGGIVAGLIIGIAILVSLFRLWFALLTAYVYILIGVVLAPLWIIGGIVPGSPINVSGWLKNLGANLLAFPATVGMFMLGKVFMEQFGKPQAPGVQSFTPPFIGNPGDLSLIGALIGLGIILMTPNIVTMLKTALKVAKIETGLGKAFGPGAAAGSRGMSGVGTLAFGTELHPEGFLNKKGKSVIGKFGRAFGLLPKQ